MDFYKKRHLIYSGIFFTTILLLWPVLMALSPIRGSVDEQIMAVSENTQTFQLQYFFAFLIAPAALYLIFALLYKTPRHRNLFFQLGIVSLAVYATLVSVSYGAQMILIPRLLEADRDFCAALWLFGSPYSASYFLNQTGYVFWGIGVMALFEPFTRRQGLQKIAGTLMLISGILSIIAYSGYILDIAFLNALTILSGIVILPVGIIAVLIGSRP